MNLKKTDSEFQNIKQCLFNILFAEEFGEKLDEPWKSIAKKTKDESQAEIVDILVKKYEEDKNPLD